MTIKIIKGGESMSFFKALWYSLIYKKPEKHEYKRFSYCPVCHMNTDKVHCLCAVSYVAVNQPLECEEASNFPPTKIQVINCDTGAQYNRNELRELQRIANINWEL